MKSKKEKSKEKEPKADWKIKQLYVKKHGDVAAQSEWLQVFVFLEMSLSRFTCNGVRFFKLI